MATGEIAEDAPETGKEYARKGGLPTVSFRQ